MCDIFQCNIARRYWLIRRGNKGTPAAIALNASELLVAIRHQEQAGPACAAHQEGALRRCCLLVVRFFHSGKRNQNVAAVPIKSNQDRAKPPKLPNPARPAPRYGRSCKLIRTQPAESSRDLECRLGTIPNRQPLLAEQSGLRSKVGSIEQITQQEVAIEASQRVAVEGKCRERPKRCQTETEVLDRADFRRVADQQSHARHRDFGPGCQP